MARAPPRPLQQRVPGAGTWVSGQLLPTTTPLRKRLAHASGVPIRLHPPPAAIVCTQGDGNPPAMPSIAFTQPILAACGRHQAQIQLHLPAWVPGQVLVPAWVPGQVLVPAQVPGQVLVPAHEPGQVLVLVLVLGRAHAVSSQQLAGEQRHTPRPTRADAPNAATPVGPRTRSSSLGRWQMTTP